MATHGVASYNNFCLHTEGFVSGPGSGIPSCQCDTVLSSCKRNQSVISSPATNSPSGQRAMRSACGADAEGKGYFEVGVDECDRIRWEQPRVTRQPCQHRIRLSQRVPAESKRSAFRPFRHAAVLLV